MAENTALALVPVPFHGDTVLAGEREGEVWVEGRSVCERFGINWSGQYEKLVSAAAEQGWARVGKIQTRGIPDESGIDRPRDRILMTMETFMIWLASISINNVKPEFKEVLRRYQQEAGRTLREHFFPKPQVQINNNLNTDALTRIAGKQLRLMTRQADYFMDTMEEHLDFLSDINQGIKDLPAATAAAIRETQIKAEGEPHLFHCGTPVPTSFATDPADIPYSALRDWAHDFVTWMSYRWGKHQQDLWPMMHNDAAYLLDYNIEYHYKSFKKRYEGSRLDMLLAKGNFREWCKEAFKRYGAGQAPTKRDRCTAPTRLDFTPVMERLDMPFEENLVLRTAGEKRRGRKRGKKQTAEGARNEAAAVASVERAVENIRKEALQAEIPSEFTPAAITPAVVVDPYEDALKELNAPVASRKPVGPINMPAAPVEPYLAARQQQ